MNEADIVFLCLPDDAARESVALIENKNTRVIDTSTAHRVNADWVYGFAELTGQREKITSAKLVSNPGCHASGFIALTSPLVENGIIDPDEQLCCLSMTGYSGGGRKMIEQYESIARDKLLDAPRLYGLNQNHKHLPEMKVYSGLNDPPAFSPIVAPFYSGMEIVVPLFNKNMHDIETVYTEYYNKGVIKFKNNTDEDGYMSAAFYSGRDDMEISVHGSDDRLTLLARFDNLGKGASGAAIQNMNIMLNMDETVGLITE